MDRLIKTEGRKRRVIIIAGVAMLALGGLALHLILKASLPSIQRDQTNFAKVWKGEFEEYVNIRGAILPETSVVLGASEGGRVERLHVEEGAMVKKGDLLLELSNTSLQFGVIRSQADLAEQMNALLGNRISGEQRSLDLNRERISVDAQLDQVEYKLSRMQELRKQGFVSDEAIADLERQKRQLTTQKSFLAKSVVENAELRRQQSRELESTVSVLQKNIGLAQQVLDKLFLRAPIDGRLTSLKAEVGSALREGDIIGQIDDESKLKVQANVDEFYIPRLQEKQRATFSYGGKEYVLEVRRIYPQVTNGQFKVDLEFVDKRPEHLRIGQSLPLHLTLSKGETAIQVSTGPYVRQSGGRYVYVYDERKGVAMRREIKLGRNNESNIEVLTGLEPGETIVTSSYESFLNAPKIRVVD